MSVSTKQEINQAALDPVDTMDSNNNLALLAEFFDWQPQAFIWLQPEFQKGIITDFRFMYSNKPGLLFLNLKQEQIGHITVWNTPSLDETLREKVFDELLEVYQTGKNVANDVFNPAIDRFATFYRSRFRGGILTTIQDKSHERVMIRELDQRSQQLEVLNRNLQEFTYAASHDLQSPLRKFASFLRKLRGELQELNETQQETFTRLENATGHMKALIDNLLAYSLVTARQKTSNLTDLNDIIQQVLQEVDDQITQTGTHIATMQLPRIKGDESQLRQLFQNLVSNAIKYRRKFGIPTIKIRHRIIEATDELLTGWVPTTKAIQFHVIEVSDNGIGFDQQYAEKIFQVFQRLHGKQEYEGTGIGLSIVQRVAQNHDGFVKAFSTPGQGATFQVILPVNQ